MVSEPTVLVLGAGASLEYGYPSGPDLVKGILESLAPGHDTDITRGLNYFGFNGEKLSKFRNALRLSDLYSIDSFIQSWPDEYGEVGKAALTLKLAAFERDHSDIHQRYGWYSYLLNRLITNFRLNKTAPLVILTFNYDRSLDHYLYVSMRNALHFSSDIELQAIFRKRVIIVHLHGMLSPLPWMENKNYTRAYGEWNLDLLRYVPDSLHIVHEEVKAVSSFDLASEALLNAKRVCFLGFSYHPSNVGRLLQTRWHLVPNKPPDIFGTAHGMTVSEQQDAETCFNRTVVLKNFKCLEMLREHSWFLN